MSVLDAAFRAATDLRHMSVDVALVGGLAVSVRGEPRNTRDVDFAVSVIDDTVAEQVIREPPLLDRFEQALFPVLSNRDHGAAPSCQDLSVAGVNEMTLKAPIQRAQSLRHLSAVPRDVSRSN